VFWFVVNAFKDFLQIKHKSRMRGKSRLTYVLFSSQEILSEINI
jgi:hypothetical protein